MVSFMSARFLDLVFGGASLSGSGGGYGFGDISETDAFKLLDTAIYLEVLRFDTAPIYGFGRSEEILGKYFKQKRESIEIMTKGGVTWHDNGRVNMTNDPNVIESMIHTSLKTLNSDYIDTYLIHYPDPKVDIRKTLEVVEKARIQGKIKNIGLSNTNSSELELALEVCPISVVQNQCNLFVNEFEDMEEFCKKNKITLMGHSVLYKGVLTGRVNLTRQFDTTDFRAWAPWWKRSDWKKKVQTVERFKAAHPDIDLLTLAITQGLKQSDAIVCGSKKPQSLREIVQRIKEPVPGIDELVEEFKALCH